MSASTIEKADRISLFFSRLGIGISGAMILVITFMIFTNVITRYFANYNMPFVEEWATLMMVPMSYLGLGFTLRNDKHIMADIIMSRLSEEAKSKIRLGIAVFALLVMLFVFDRALELCIYNFERGATSSGPMRTPLWLPSLTMVAGLCIFCLDIFFWILHSLLKILGKQRLHFHM